MNPKIPLLLLFIILITPGFPQKFLYFPTYNVDSLLNILPEQQTGDRVNTLNKLAVSLSFVDFDSSMHYAAEAMKLAEKLNYQAGIADVHTNYGHIYRYQGDYVKALNEYFRALKLYKKLGMKRQVASLYHQISIIHYLVVNHEKSLEYGFIALDSYRELTPEGISVGSVKDTMLIRSGMALIYFLQGKCEESLEITLNYLDIGQKNNFDKTDLYMFLILAGERYRCIGENDSAKKYLEKAISLPGNNPSMEALKYRAITSMGRVYLQEGNFDSMISLYRQAYAYYNKRGFLYMALSTSYFMGYTYYQYNDDATAEKYFKQAEKFFDEIVLRDSWHRHDSLKNITSWGLEMYFPLPPQKTKDIVWNTARWMYYWLYKINEESGKFESALNYHKLYTNSDDTLSKIRNLEGLVKLQLQYETQNYEEEIGLLAQETEFQEFKLKQSRYFMFGLSALVMLVVILAIVLIRQNRLRDQQQNLLLQQKLFRSQMNPHFIFNSLTSIQNFILDAEAHKASKYLSRFSKLIRNILDSSIQENVWLAQEISTIENYLELQKLRFKNKFDYSIEVDEAINPESINIPPMLAQPFIENSIEHGIKYKKSKGNIHIRFLLKNKCLVFEVEDDGVGRMEAQEILYKLNKDHKSLATAITHERIQALNKKRKKKITLHILDLRNNNGEAAGTKVILQIPSDL